MRIQPLAALADFALAVATLVLVLDVLDPAPRCLLCGRTHCGGLGMGTAKLDGVEAS
jgi:hypothetical protein